DKKSRKGQRQRQTGTGATLIDRQEIKERPTPEANRHRGNANKPTRNQGKANAIGKQAQEQR
ncbi:hypothetical protein PQR34_19000, partial [Paraburkholderia sediminicola]|uniref:hypothetical protein n=1 Tax=Paraburkholderia sediminicola TaxID=458836 RepID=UPI0038B731E5